MKKPEKRLVVVAEEVTARRLEEKPFVFNPQAKVYLMTGHMPTIRKAGEGFWRRVRPTDKDKTHD